MGLEMKISRVFSSIGNKVKRLATKVGDKTNQKLNSAKNIATRIPKLNEKTINFGNNIRGKSGQATDILRKSSGIAAAVTNGLAQIGGDIPLVRSALKAGAKAT